MKTRQIEAFMEACIDQNTCRELVYALAQRSADATDCKTWRITPTEWRQAIRDALLDKLSYIESIINP